MFSSQNSQVSSAANYIEDVFSTYLYTGNGSTQTITNNIDLSTKGGLVWMKKRSAASTPLLFDTNRGATNAINTISTQAQSTISNGLTSFNSNGFSIGGFSDINSTGSTFASWTFRKQPKFFDVVTWTGDGVDPRQISHSLGSVPGCIIIKKTSATSNWWVMHRSLPAWDYYLTLNTTDAANNAAGLVQTPTSTSFNATGYNNSGQTYVAYLFAHNAGGFGLTGTDNVISCGSYTGTGGANSITLGYEPQWLLVKRISADGNPWVLVDNMRGWVNGEAANDQVLKPNASSAESSYYGCHPTATGFEMTNSDGDNDFNGPGSTYIYIAIRRGPMKVPTNGTTVFSTSLYTGTGATTNSVDTTITPDSAWFFHRDLTSGTYIEDRLRGNSVPLRTPFTNAEITTWTGAAWGFDKQNGMYLNSSNTYFNSGGASQGIWSFKRAPNFFDEVCYTGTGSATTVTHNLGVAPELMILKRRDSSSSEWPVYAAPLGATQGLYLGPYSDPAITTSAYWNDTAPTASVFTVGNSSASNFSGGQFVAYLFASCPGVSKVGSFTNTGSTINVNCGFTGGARFILFKKTSASGSWYVYDTARGINAGADPYLALNLTDSEYTSSDDVDAYSSGFTFNGGGWGLGDYIYLAIA